MKLSYIPPLMVYFSAGASGATSIATTFFVKDHLGLSAEFLAALTFWATLPWTLKIPLGHLADLMWRHRSILVYVGAIFISASLLIMIGLLSSRESMASLMPIQTWYVMVSMLSPIGYVL